MISSNPVAAVRRPRARRPEVHWPTSAQLGALLQASRGTVWEVPILLAAVTGARRSELLGIAWTDVDLNAGMAFIRRGVQPVRGADRTSTIAFTPLKTKRARRQVQLPSFALERVRRHRREQLTRRTALGPEWRDPVDERGEPLAMVCDRGDGSPLYPDSFSSAFKRLARQAGLHPATRLHDMRHAVATELGRQGVHPVIVSAVLGHASPAFTVAVYQHAWQQGQAEVASALEAALGPGSPALAIGWHTRQAGGRRTTRLLQTNRSEAWGGEDSNLRPTDYELRPSCCPVHLVRSGALLSRSGASPGPVRVVLCCPVRSRSVARRVARLLCSDLGEVGSQTSRATAPDVSRSLDPAEEESTHVDQAGRPRPDSYSHFPLDRAYAIRCRS
ncbi:MAG: site-specific integrase [Actinomycetota bacterium]